MEGYNFGEVHIFDQTSDTELTPVKIFNAATGFEKLVEEIIVRESIRYAHHNGRSFTLTDEEAKAFFGMNFVMGYHCLPTFRSYWSTDPDMGVPYIANVMPINRFEEIRTNLHFSDNSNEPNRTDPSYDRAFKIRPVIDHFNHAFQRAMANTKTQAIDEHMIKFKGHNIMRQYVKNKPIKWGFKMWCRACSSTGYLFQFDLYTGKKRGGSETGLGDYLLVKNMNRGDIFAASSNGISFIKWMDNKAVFLLTNFLSPIPTTIVKKRVSGSAEKVNVICPEAIIKYNKHMGGVDLMDQKKVYYEVDRKAKIKYYLRLFFDLLDIAMNNSYVIYCKLHEAKRIEGTLLTSLEFRQVVARSLIGSFSSRQRSLSSVVMTKKRISYTQKRGTPSQVMVKVSNRKRCVQWAKSRIENRTNNTCSTCNVHLCFTTDRNCFVEYH
ncbi:unnamed protein product [Parnassius apollo]|uniref:(apollo) hypothetical protein n=1 Tax=Parnassius apollo TaxID=110799 RepID=A0A8S3X1B1_PARAO|nr:unnamed protein product [Parnassius apollo]